MAGIFLASVLGRHTLFSFSGASSPLPLRIFQPCVDLKVPPFLFFFKILPSLWPPSSRPPIPEAGLCAVTAPHLNRISLIFIFLVPKIPPQNFCPGPALFVFVFSMP